MLWKNTWPSRALALSASFVLSYSTLVFAGPAPVDSEQGGAAIAIVYPKEGQLLSAVDSAFILGNVPPETKKYAYKLFVNDRHVAVHPQGGFIAWVPVEPGDFEFVLKAFRVEKGRYDYLAETNRTADILPLHILYSLTKTLKVKIPEPLKSMPYDTLVAARDYRPPLGDLVLATHDRLSVSFQATPGHWAWFSVPGVVDSVPMAEMAPVDQPYWGEAVFGAGAVPDSLKINGIYSGFYDVASDDRCDQMRVGYHLGPLSLTEMLERYWTPPYEHADSILLQLLSLTDTVALDTASSYAVTINSPDYPFSVRFTDSVQIVRHAPMKGYFSIFQPEGVEVLAVGAEADWYKVQLSRNQFGWVSKRSVQRLPGRSAPMRSYPNSVRFHDLPDKLLIELPLSGRHPFRVIEDDARTLRLQLFGVISNTDWIRYNSSTSLVRLAQWRQLEEDLYELSFSLTEKLWGYDTYYQGNTFYLQLNKPPDDLDDIEKKIIVIDPGHSRDKGAVGPTGYTEAEANLGIALVLADKLVSKGAEVYMTRTDTTHVPLYDRPAIAKLADADLFVSIHNNALPDGVNPLVNNGTSIYYYHPHSIELARAIHKEMLEETELPDFGMYHGNLAVSRPTQYPAVLVECAFMIIPEQEAMLKTDKFREKVAEAITKGIEKFLENFDDD